MIRLPPLIVILASTALPALLATEAAGQERVRISGRVVDNATDAGIAAVDIVLRTRDDRFVGTRFTDENGRFVIDVPFSIEAVRLYASRIGFANSRTPLLWFDDHDAFEIEIRLDPEAVLLAPLEVLAWSEAAASPVLSGFQQRLETGSGFYITRAEIEMRKPVYVTDLLATVPGVRLGSSGSGRRRTISIGRAGPGCPVQVYVDGLLVTTGGRGPSFSQNFGASIDDFVSPLSIEGIEIYRGLSTVPAEFLTPDAECGVVAIWTRRGR